MQLITNDTEIYTKKGILYYTPKLDNFINRKEILLVDKLELTLLLQEWIDIVKNYGEYHLENYILSCNGEIINTKNETILKNKNLITHNPKGINYLYELFLQKVETF